MYTCYISHTLTQNDDLTMLFQVKISYRILLWIGHINVKFSLIIPIPLAGTQLIKMLFAWLVVTSNISVMYIGGKINSGFFVSYHYPVGCVLEPRNINWNQNFIASLLLKKMVVDVTDLVLCSSKKLIIKYAARCKRYRFLLLFISNQLLFYMKIK